MGVSPQKNETDVVIAILQSEEFDTPKQMAAAIVRALGKEFERRDGYGVGIALPTEPGLVLPHGPYFNIGDAKRVVAEAHERGLRAFIAPLFAPERALMEEPELEIRDKRCTCKHPHALHGVAMTSFNGKSKPMTSLGCCVYKNKVKCPCMTYEAA